jgi:hypothetical protein
MRRFSGELRARERDRRRAAVGIRGGRAGDPTEGDAPGIHGPGGSRAFRGDRLPPARGRAYAALAARLLFPAAGIAGGMVTTALARGRQQEPPADAATLLSERG